MFTVIIPLYNKAPYVENAIRSVLNQTFTEFELIVVNDGSSDNSLQIVEDFFQNLTDLEISVCIIQQSNSGVSTARNRGAQIAKYNYLTFLDADDWWAPNFLEDMKNLILQYPDGGIYGSSYFQVKNGINHQAKIGVLDDFHHGYINYFKVYSSTLWMPLTSISVVIPKKVFNKLKGFNSHLKMGEDFDLWSRIAIEHRVVYLNIPLAFYNQDIVRANRAVGNRLYEPNEHVLFNNFDRKLQSDKDFKYLFDRLALYGLLPYYSVGKNKIETSKILSGIDWKQHEIKYYIYYIILPKWIFLLWMRLLKLGSIVKKRIVDMAK